MPHLPHALSHTAIAVGERFGRLLVVETGLHRHDRPALRVRCDCGNERVVQQSNVRRGYTRSCGCLRGERFRRGVTCVRAVDRIGEVYGRLTIIAVGEVTGTNRRFHVRCVCGNVTNVTLNNLVTGKTRSCGCLLREVRSAMCTTHGMTGTYVYSTWAGMRARCTVPTASGYSNYGGRGITICAGWAESIESFAADMGPRPSDKHSVDRRDNEGGYWCGHCEECVSLGRPANCRWATTKEQARNRRVSGLYRHVVLNGERLLAADVYPRFGISRQAFEARISAGWPDDKAATTPPIRTASSAARRKMARAKRARDRKNARASRAERTAA